MESGKFPSPQPSPARGEGACLAPRPKPHHSASAIHVLLRSFGFSRLTLLSLLLIVFSFVQPIHAAQKTKLIVVVANRLVLADLDNSSLPNISKMINDGGVGLVSPNCAGPKSEASVMLTAGAGVGCKGGAYLREFYDADERTQLGLLARDAYASSTGYKSPKFGGVLLGLGQALRDNSDPGRSVALLGACGEALKAAGITTCVIGNSDSIPDKIDRTAGALVMDSRGTVGIGGFNVKSSPLEWNMKRDRLSATFFYDDNVLQNMAAAVSRHAGIVVIDYGDSVRLDEYKKELSDTAYATQKQVVLKGLDRLVGKLLGSADASDMQLMLVSFSPSRAPGERWIQPTPMVIYPSARKGFLISPTTRTAGFVAASDFAPTVLTRFNVPIPSDMVGRAIQTVPCDRYKTLRLRDIENRVVTGEKLYTPFLLTLAFLGATVFTLTVLLAAFWPGVLARLSKKLRVLFVFCASLPLGMLLAVFAPPTMLGCVGGTVVFAVATMVVSLAITAALGSRRRPLTPILIVYGLTLIAIVIDAACGCPLVKFCLPSGYQITAMRFYGIGNEYAGIAIAMASCFCLFTTTRWRKLTTLLVGPLIAVTFGLGALGANYGGALASLITFILLWMAVWKGNFSGRHVILSVVLAFAVVMTFAVLDLKLAGKTASHAGRATDLMEKLGLNYIFALVIRKVLLNLSLVVSKQATWIYAAFAPFLALWFWKIQGKVANIYAGDKSIAAGIRAIVIGSVAGFLFNDSGIVMFAIIITLTVLVLLYSLLTTAEAHKCPE